MHQSVTFRFQNFSNRFDGICINFEREKLISRKVSVAVLKKNWYRKKYRYRFQKSISIGFKKFGIENSISIGFKKNWY